MMCGSNTYNMYSYQFDVSGSDTYNMLSYQFDVWVLQYV